MNKFQFVPLNEMADISISNVDKKTNTDETDVLLCNYVDVYRNWAITQGMRSKFMRATANAREIEKFALHKGDVCITKDSETKDDIGMSTYIADDIQGLILGYHCALISPKDHILDGKYLNAFLQTDFVRHFYELNASGSGQRYTLSLDIIGSIPVPVIPLEKQHKIGHLFSIIDRKIETNKQINDNLQHQLKLMYDYWFTQFDFPDENGKPYRSSGGAMVWNELLKREIPKGWNVSSLASLISNSKNGDWGKDFAHNNDDIKVNCFRGADFSTITDDYHITAPIRYISSKHGDRLLADGDLVIEISGGSPSQSTGRIGYINSRFLERNGGKMDCSNFCKAFSPQRKIYQFWIYHTWRKLYDAGVMFNFEGKTTGIKNLMFDELITSIKIPIPSDALLEKYQTLCSCYFNSVQDSLIESAKLSSLRDWLLPMLMNGQATISD